MADRDVIKAIKEGTKDIGNKVIDNVQDVAGGLGNILKNTSSALRGDMRQMAGTIGGEVSEVMGPELSKMTESVSSMGKNVVTSIFSSDASEEETKSDKTRNSLLENMVNYFKREEKRLAREMPGKKMGLGMKAIMAIVIAFGLLVGGLIRTITLPFEMLYKVVKSVVVFFRPLLTYIKEMKFIKGIFGKGGLIAEWAIKFGNRFVKTTKFISGIFGKEGLIAARFVKIFTWFKEAKGLLGIFFRSIQTGFKILGWPLTMLLGLIDFVRGFMSTEGSIVEKIKGGLLAAIKGFFDPIIWVFDWVGKKLGIGEIGTKIYKSVTMVMGYITDFLMWPVNFVMNFIEGYKKEGFMGGISNAFNSLWQSFADLAGTILNYFQTIPTKIFSWIGKIFGFDTEAIEITFDFKSWLLGLPGRIWEWIKGTFTFEKPDIKSDSTNWLAQFFENIWTWVKEAITTKLSGSVAKSMGITPGMHWSDKERKMVPDKEPESTKPDKIKTVKTESTAKRADDIQKKKVTFYKIKEEEKKQEQQKMVDEDRKVKQEQTAAINQQTTVISQTSQGQKAPTEEIPSEIDNYVLALATMEF